MSGGSRYLRSDDDLLIEAVREVAAALGPIVAELAAARARFLVAEEIERRDLVVRATQDGQPTGTEVATAILAELRRHAGKRGSTSSGAHDVARRVAIAMGVVGNFPAHRRTRAQVDADPNPHRRREGRARAAAAERAAGQGERW